MPLEIILPQVVWLPLAKLLKGTHQNASGDFAPLHLFLRISSWRQLSAQAQKCQAGGGDPHQGIKPAWQDQKQACQLSWEEKSGQKNSVETERIIILLGKHLKLR